MSFYWFFVWCLLIYSRLYKGIVNIYFIGVSTMTQSFTQTRLFDHMVKVSIENVNEYMALGLTYKRSLMMSKRESCASKKVWGVVANHFKN